ncbi:MAG: ATP-dependent DNA ligase, partial [Methanomassiliicoccales archaeon]
MDWFDLLTEGERERVREQTRSRWVEPMLATLTHDRFSDPGWVFEPKLDGERCLAYLEEGTALMSRNRKPLNESYPE